MMFGGSAVADNVNVSPNWSSAHENLLLYTFRWQSSYVCCSLLVTAAVTISWWHPQYCCSTWYYRTIEMFFIYHCEFTNKQILDCKTLLVWQSAHLWNAYCKTYFMLQSMFIVYACTWFIFVLGLGLLFVKIPVSWFAIIGSTRIRLIVWFIDRLIDWFDRRPLLSNKMINYSLQERNV